MLFSKKERVDVEIVAAAVMEKSCHPKYFGKVSSFRLLMVPLHFVIGSWSWSLKAAMLVHPKNPTELLLLLKNQMRMLCRYLQGHCDLTADLWHFGISEPHKQQGSREGNVGLLVSWSAHHRGPN